MKFTEKLVKQISETAYLTEENSNRYRPIMRYFYHKHEQAENWLYKEEIYETLKEHFPFYTIEECQRDLDFLVNKQSLTTVQDTENANTLEKFKFKNYRYQMTDYAIEIERLTIRLEQMEVKVSSLEPRLFERLELRLARLRDMKTASEADLYELWSDLMADFDNLNYSYQDFLKKFQEPKTEELLQSVAFIDHKNHLVRYLQNFIKEYLAHSKKIKTILETISEEDVTFFMDSLISYQKKAPKIRPDFDYDDLRSVNIGRWMSLKKWFLPLYGVSEGERLLRATNQIISKITKYAANLIELHGNMISRKEEYKYLCRLFDEQISLPAAHELAGAILGVSTVRHVKGISNLNSDSIIESYGVKPIEITLDPMHRGLRTRLEKTPIVDKSLEKEKLLAAYQKEEEEKRRILRNFIEQNEISLTGEITLSPDERRYVFTLIEKSERSCGVDPVFGYSYQLTPREERCRIQSSDGVFIMPGFLLQFGGVRHA